MTSILDPHSGVLTAAEYRRNAAPEEFVEGLGLDLEPYGGVGPLLVGVVVPGSPAQRGGLRPGDRITHVNEKAIADYPTGQSAVEALFGVRRHAPREDLDAPLVVPPQSVTVRYRRPGMEGDRQVELVTQRYRPESVFGVRRLADNSWDYWLDRKAGLAQVRLGSLGVGAADELREVLLRLESDGLRGLVLDLRACPGGFLREALACAGQFVGDVPVATVRSRGQPEAVHRGAGEGKFLVLPLVVLVNGDTSGGGELIAAALKDHGRAVIVGQRTRGKASVQTPIHLGLEGVGMKLTSGTFLRPSGKNLHRFPESKPSDDWGVLPEPAYTLRLSPELTQALREWWQLQTLRPGDSREPLPLDDPANDPLRTLAVRALLEQMSLPRTPPSAK
jgi:carboxyl-terminal processing protease